MYSAFTVADWFILKNNANKKEFECEEYGAYEGITHLKLQKLLYYAQGIHLAITGKKLFEEKIYAWRHGPVVSEVYQKFKECGSEAITITPDSDMEKAVGALDEAALNTLELTYANFAIYTAWQLRNMTHEVGTPWDYTVKNKKIGAEIPIDVMQKYFAENVVDYG